MRFVVPAEQPIVDKSGIQFLIEQQYDLGGLDITEVAATRLMTPTFIPPALNLEDIPRRKIDS